MKGLFTVFNYELNQHIRKKSVIVTTIVLALILFGITFIPRLIPLFSGSGGSDADPKDISYGYVLAQGAWPKGLEEAVQSLPAKRYETRSELEIALKDGELKTGFYLESPLKFETLYMDRTLYASADIMPGLLASFYTNSQLVSKGINPEELPSILHPEVEQTTTVLGQDNTSTAFIAMFLMLIVYFLVLIYGIATATMVAREKDSRAMELLITSTSARSLILGKVFASAVAAIMQLSVILFAAFVGYQINKSTFPEVIHLMLSGTLTTNYVVAYIFYTLVGYLMYLFLYAALGSTVSRVEDVSSATAPIQFLFIFGYMIAAFGMNMSDSILFRVASIIPFTGVLVMPLRTALVSVPMTDHILAAGLMGLFTVLIAYLAIRIYRWGTLNYGNKTSLRKVVTEALRNKD
ncbi:MAG: ABC transporter permease [Christensenellales bacterium]|jgi:ABC-2 type transport system permease protein